LICHDKRFPELARADTIFAIFIFCTLFLFLFLFLFFFFFFCVRGGL